MQESNIEKYLKKCVEQNGGLCLKLISVSMRGLPDRIVILPKGRIFFAEIKAPTQKPRLEQIRVHNIFKKLGVTVYVIDSREKARRVISEICTP